MRDDEAAVDAGKQWVGEVLTGWFPLIHAWWWRSNGDGVTLFVEGSTQVAQSKTFDSTLLRDCGKNDARAKRRARENLEALLIRSAR